MTGRPPSKTAQYYRGEYRRRRERALAYLGGCCMKCGAQDKLEFDHIVPEQKGFDLNLYIRCSWSKLKTELDKCQLFCRHHHRAKHGIASLTIDMVSEIKRRLRDNETVASVAQDFPVCRRTIRKIRSGERWASVA